MCGMVSWYSHGCPHRQSSRCSSLIMTKSLLRKNVVSLACSSKKSRCWDRLRHSGIPGMHWGRWWKMMCDTHTSAHRPHPHHQHWIAPHLFGTWCPYAGTNVHHPATRHTAHDGTAWGFCLRQNPCFVADPPRSATRGAMEGTAL